MYKEKWGEIVADWLWEDQKLKKKQRRTNKKFFQKLKDMGFNGSYRTLCYFVKEWREGRYNTEETRDKNSESLIHPSAEAQLDFGIMEAVKEGKYVDIHCLVMTLPFSNTAYAMALTSGNQECVLQGLKEIFEQLGGVPKKFILIILKLLYISLETERKRPYLPMNFFDLPIIMDLNHKHVIQLQVMKREM